MSSLSAPRSSAPLQNLQFHPHYWTTVMHKKPSFKRSPIFKKPTRPHLLFLSPFSIRASPKFSLRSLLGWSFPLHTHPAPRRLYLAAYSAHLSCAQTPAPSRGASLLPETLSSFAIRPLHSRWFSFSPKLLLGLCRILLFLTSCYTCSGPGFFLAGFASSSTCTAQGTTSNPLILYPICDCAP